MMTNRRTGQAFVPAIILIAVVAIGFFLYRALSQPKVSNNNLSQVDSDGSLNQLDDVSVNGKSADSTSSAAVRDTANTALNSRQNQRRQGPSASMLQLVPLGRQPIDGGDGKANSGNGIPISARPWEAWDKPNVALLLTSQQKGYFEPCGCTANQLGGMSRRFDLVSKMRAAGWEVRGLDSGDLSRRSGRQANLKMMTTLSALQQMNYLGVGLGAAELQLSVDGLLDVQMEMLNAESSVPFISANVTVLEGGVDGLPLKHRIVDVGGLKLGITCVMSKSVQQEIFPLADAESTSADEALKTVLTEFDQQQVDVRILISQSTLEESLDYAARFPQFQIVLTSRGVGDPDKTAAPRKIGQTLVIEPGYQGKYAGILGIYSKQQPQFRYQLISMDRDAFDDSPSMVKLMQQYQDRLKDEQVAKRDVVSAPHPSQSTFVGGAKCAECHDVSTEIWKNTPHSHAFDSLDPVHKRLGYERLNGINRSWDPECLSCHVTGWDPQQYTRFASGFLNEEFAESDAEKRLHRLMLHSQCENCHGPGSKHVELAETGADNVAESVKITLANAEQQCKRCHDGDNSPDFDFKSYWERVKHYEE